MYEVVFQNFMMNEGSKETRCKKYWSRGHPLVVSGHWLLLLPLVLHFVTVAHMFWDFGFVFSEALRRHSGQLVAAATVHDLPTTLRRPQCCLSRAAAI